MAFPVRIDGKFTSSAGIRRRVPEEPFEGELSQSWCTQNFIAKVKDVFGVSRGGVGPVLAAGLQAECAEFRCGKNYRSIVWVGEPSGMIKGPHDFVYLFQSEEPALTTLVVRTPPLLPQPSAYLFGIEIVALSDR
jgi:hypothetical protein